LATAAFTGSVLGLAVLWAVVVGAFLKFVLNEGLARWQLATSTTLLEGCADRFGKPIIWLFLCYMVVWSFLVAAALMGAVGVTGHAIYPLFGSEAANANKVFYGVLHSVVAVVLVNIGGYRLFGKIMSACIGVMFVVVVVTAVAMRPPFGELASGLLWPKIPAITSQGVPWTIALMGGVGGTLTVLCYGYWIREEGRQGIEDLKTCRIDLATGYVMTAVFGLAMVVIGSSLGSLEGKGGAKLIVEIAGQLEATLGPLAKWAFLLGAWGAVFSSLLGVWQSVPYLFADSWSLATGRRDGRRTRKVETRSFPYRAYLYGIALLPMAGLAAVPFKTMQKTYAVVGALCIPILAITLLLLNGRTKWVGARYRNSLWTSLVLIAALLFFALAGCLQIHSKLFVKRARSARDRPRDVAAVRSKDLPGLDLTRLRAWALLEAPEEGELQTRSAESLPPPLRTGLHKASADHRRGFP